MNKPIIKTGIGALIGGYLVFLITFLTAYFNRSKTVCIDINHFKEANLELWFFSLITVFASIAIYNITVNYIKS